MPGIHLLCASFRPTAEAKAPWELLVSGQVVFPVFTFNTAVCTLREWVEAFEWEIASCQSVWNARPTYWMASPQSCVTELEMAQWRQLFQHRERTASSLLRFLGNWSLLQQERGSFSEMKKLIFDFLSCVWEGMEDALIQFSKLPFWSGVHSNVLSQGYGFEHHIVWCFAEKYFENVLKHKPLLSSLKEGVWTPLACSLSTVFFALPIWCYLLSPQPPSPAAFHVEPCPYRTLAELKCPKMVSVWAAVIQGQVFMMYQTVNLSWQLSNNAGFTLE